MNVGNGPLWLTQTPLLGISEVVRRFLHEKSPDRHVTFMTIDMLRDHAQFEDGSVSVEAGARWIGRPIAKVQNW